MDYFGSRTALSNNQIQRTQEPLLKNCTESTERTLPWWPVSSLGEIPRGHSPAPLPRNQLPGAGVGYVDKPLFV
jgi:hypothetical protein